MNRIYCFTLKIDMLMKRFMISVALSVCTMLSWAQFSGSGSGTENDPYLIFYADQLNQVRNFLNQEGVYFKLMSNLNLTTWLNGNNPGLGWEPVGTEAAPFKGVFDGNGKTLSGFTISRSSTICVGLFGSTNGATLKNLTIVGEVTGGQNTGAFVGYAIGGTLNGLTLQGNVSGGESTGGIVGYAIGGTLNRLTLQGNVSGGESTGGIVGYAKSSILTNLRTSNLTVNSLADCVGGVCGTAEDTSLSECYSYSTVNGQNRVGGIVGYNYGIYRTRTMTLCLSFGDIRGKSYVGGIVGEFKNKKTYNSNSIEYDRVSRNYSASYHIINCIALGNITADGTHAGGIAGYFRGGGVQENNTSTYFATQAIRDSYFSGNIVGTQFCGGIIGQQVGPGVVSNNYVHGKIQGTSRVGGIVGCTELYTPVSYTDYSWYTFYPTIQSNMALNPSVAGTENVGRIYGSAIEGTVIGENGNAAQDNRALYDTRIILSGVDTPVTDDAQNGVSNGDAYFKLKANYVGHGWDFNTDWTNQETETYPYKPWQSAPPTITSSLVSGAQSIIGQSIDGGTVYVKIGKEDYVSVACNGNDWTLTGISPLQSGVTVTLYVKSDDKEVSYLVQEQVSYPGSGTAADPWRVYTAADLQGVYKSGYYKQMNDIDLTAWIAENSNTTGWVAVGRTGSGQINYDGGGFKITGLWTNSTEEYTGLFSHFDNGTIKNLNVEVASKQVKGGNNTGALIGCITNGCIENVTVTGNVQGGPVVGGVIGSTANTTVQHIAFTGKVTSATASAEVGGLVGQAGEGTVLGNSSSDTTVKATGSEAKAGGLIGTVNGTVRCCFSSGTVSGTASDSYIGGLVGQVNANGSIANCYSTADVSSKLYAAGLVAYNYGAIDKCYASGNVNSVYYGAGLVGYNDGTNASVANSVALGAKVEVSDETGWGIRVLGGFKNSAPVPDESNYGWSGMQISVNGVPKIVEDNILDGQSLSNTE